MLLVLDPLLAIPLHGMIQLVANGSRTWFQRQYLEGWILCHCAILIIPMALLGLFAAQSFPTQALQCGIGAFVLVVTWRLNWLFLGMCLQDIDPGKMFLALGGAVGFLNMTIGATRPLIAPFYLNLGLHRQALVGTKATSQPWVILLRS